MGSGATLWWDKIVFKNWILILLLHCNSSHLTEKFLHISLKYFWTGPKNEPVSPPWNRELGSDCRKCSAVSDTSPLSRLLAQVVQMCICLDKRFKQHIRCSHRVNADPLNKLTLHRRPLRSPLFQRSLCQPSQPLPQILGELRKNELFCFLVIAKRTTQNH